MPRNLVTAILRSASGPLAAIDHDNGVIRGVKLMEVGKLAKFAGEDGKQKQVKISEKHIEALLSHAGNRAIPIHETHDWFDAQGKPGADTAEMAARIGALKGFRTDDNGNLIADAYFRAGEKRDAILWGAEHNPEDNCFSVVFSYLKDDPECIPQNFRAGDLVPNGAATTALFSEDQTQTTNTMDINELIAALADPKVQDAVNAIIKSHKKDASTEDSAAEDTAAATMESDAGVTDADKKPEDEQKPALMRASIRIARATARLRKELATDRTALLAEAKMQAEASQAALLGRSGAIKVIGDAPHNGDEIEAAIQKKIAGGAATRATAIFRLASDPDTKALYNTARAAGKL